MNPVQGGMKWTSLDRAHAFCRRGLAELHANRLYFLDNTQDQRSAEQQFAVNRGGMLYWNGDSKDPYAMFKPGEIRS